MYYEIMSLIADINKNIFKNTHFLLKVEKVTSPDRSSFNRSVCTNNQHVIEICIVILS